MVDVDLRGNTLVVDGLKPQKALDVKTYGLNTKQAVNNVNDTAPTKSELTTSFGNPVTLGRGFVGTVDDADGNTNSYIVWTSDTDFFYLKGTKAS